MSEVRPASYYRPIDIERMEFVARLVPAGNRVLDIGAYDGKFAEMVRGCDVVSIDIEPRNIGVIKASVTNLPFKNKSFGVVVAMETLEHLSNDELRLALREIDRVARDSIIISVPLDEVPLGAEHLQRFDMKRMLRLFLNPGIVAQIGKRRTYCGVRKWLGKKNRKAMWIWNAVFGDKGCGGAVWVVVKYNRG